MYYRVVTNRTRAAVTVNHPCTIVNIALSQLCVGAHLRYLPRADSELQTQLSYMGGRPPLPYTAVTFPAVRLVPNYAVRWVTRGTCV